MEQTTKRMTLPLVAAMVLGGCANNATFSDNQRAAIGTAIGAVAGGVLGHQVNHHKGRYVGAVAGALAGAALGNYMDRQQHQLQQQMQGTGVSVSRVNESTLQLNIPGDVLFTTNQYQIKPAFYRTLNAVAQTMNQYPQTIVHVYGYTDSVGTANYNQGLSQRRANAAAQYLSAQGVDPQRMVIRGFGESHPRATNANAEGRAQNRRVEVFIKAISAENPQAAYQPVY